MLPNRVGHNEGQPVSFVRPRTASALRSDSNHGRLPSALLVVALLSQEVATRGGFSLENILSVWTRFQTQTYKYSSKESPALASLEVSPGQKTSFVLIATSQVTMQRIVLMVRNALRVAKPATRKQTALTAPLA